MDKYQDARERMVEQQIARKGIRDESVLAAMRKVPRHLFVSPDFQTLAYADRPLRIGSGQTISQPYIVALMTELLAVQPEHRALDVGTGSGYQAAILGELAAEVHSIERHPELAEMAKTLLKKLGYANVTVHVGDGSQGLASKAPFDRIIVGAAAPSVPDALLEQLAEGGRLVIPVGGRFSQRLTVWEKQEGALKESRDSSVVFVPLIGEYGWDEG